MLFCLSFHFKYSHKLNIQKKEQQNCLFLDFTLEIRMISFLQLLTRILQSAIYIFVYNGIITETIYTLFVIIKVGFGIFTYKNSSSFVRVETLQSDVRVVILIILAATRLCY